MAGVAAEPDLGPDGLWRAEPSDCIFNSVGNDTTPLGLARNTRKPGAPTPGVSAVTSSFAGGGRPASHISLRRRVGKTSLPMKIVSWPRSRQAMAAPTPLPCWRHRRCGHCLTARAAPGETSDSSLGSDNGGAIGAALSLGQALFLEQLLEEGCKKRSGLRCSGGNPRSGYPRSDDDGLSGSFSLLWASFWSNCGLGRARGGGVLRHLPR